MSLFQNPTLTSSYGWISWHNNQASQQHKKNSCQLISLMSTAGNKNLSYRDAKKRLKYAVNYFSIYKDICVIYILLIHTEASRLYSIMSSELRSSLCVLTALSIPSIYIFFLS